MKIFLIGFMGSGKSSIGKLLSVKLDYALMETDLLVEMKLKQSIAEIFSNLGEAGFRQAENQVMLDIFSKSQKAIISTGGGTPCFFDHIKLMNSCGITVYLKRSAADLYHFLKDDNKIRPVLSGFNDLKTGVENLLKSREKFYNMAKYILEVEANETDEKVVELIVKLLRLQ